MLNTSNYYNVCHIVLFLYYASYSINVIISTEVNNKKAVMQNPIPRTFASQQTVLTIHRLCLIQIARAMNVLHSLTLCSSIDFLVHRPHGSPLHKF